MVIGVIVALLAVYTNPVERVRQGFFPPGAPVPVTQLAEGGPAHPAPGTQVVAATSLEALSQTMLGDRLCLEQECWRDVHVPPATLLVATIPTRCGSREWYGWTNGSMLTIDLVTWGCVGLRPGDEARAAATYALLGIPLNRLPRGRLLVSVVDSGAPPVQVTVSWPALAPGG